MHTCIYPQCDMKYKPCVMPYHIKTAMVHAPCNKHHGNGSRHMLQAPLTYVYCNTHHMEQLNHPMKTNP
jgi:hypothetical protein